MCEETNARLINFHIASRVLKLFAEKSGVDCSDSDNIDDLHIVVDDLVYTSLGMRLPTTQHCCEHFVFAVSRIHGLRPNPMIAYGAILADSSPLARTVGPLLLPKVKTWLSLLLQIPSSLNPEKSDAVLVGDFMRENLELRHELELRRLADV